MTMFLIRAAQQHKLTFVDQLRQMFFKSFIDHSVSELIKNCMKKWVFEPWETSKFLKKIKKDSDLFVQAPDRFHEMIMDEDVWDSIMIYIENLLRPQTRNNNNRTRMNSLIFSGPPGTGKTEMMRHIAIQLKKSFIRKPPKIFFLIGSHLIIKDEEKAISILSNIFQQLTNHIKKGRIAYLAIDEADSILSNNNNLGNRSGLLTHFLSLMSAIELQNATLTNGGQCIFVISTNIPEAITPAFSRRLLQITFGIPKLKTQVKVFEHYIKKYTNSIPSLKMTIPKQEYTRIISLFLQSITQGVIENIIKAACMMARHYYPFTGVLTSYCLFRVLKEELIKHYTMTEKLSSEQAEKKASVLNQEIQQALSQDKQHFIPAEREQQKKHLLLQKKS